MVVDRDMDQMAVYCVGERLTEVDNIQYLGVNLNKRNLNETELNI